MLLQLDEGGLAGRGRSRRSAVDVLWRVRGFRGVHPGLRRTRGALVRAPQIRKVERVAADGGHFFEMNRNAVEEMGGRALVTHWPGSCHRFRSLRNAVNCTRDTFLCPNHTCLCFSNTTNSLLVAHLGRSLFLSTAHSLNARNLSRDLSGADHACFSDSLLSLTNSGPDYRWVVLYPCCVLFSCWCVFSGFFSFTTD